MSRAQYQLDKTAAMGLISQKKKVSRNDSEMFFLSQGKLCQALFDHKNNLKSAHIFKEGKLSDLPDTFYRQVITKSDVSSKDFGKSGGSIHFRTKGGPIEVMKIGRNEPCPCNSGKKFKKCCLINH